MSTESKDAAHAEVRALVRAKKHGVLCTLSKKEGGWPFGSIVPYGLSPRAEPIMYLARIAEHFRNIEADERVSLFVHEGTEMPGADVQEHGRVTLMGRARLAKLEERDDFWARYRARLPQAESYSRTHGFELFLIELTKVRYIGGFGKIFWLEPSDVLEDPNSDPLREVAAMVMNHMNADHADALIAYCQAFAGIAPRSAEMVGVDAHGMDLLTREPDLRVRVDFLQAATADTVRRATIELLAAAREQIARR